MLGDEGGEFKLTYEINAPIACVVDGDPPAWNSVDVDLIQRLQDAARALAAKCGLRPDTLIMGAKAASLFMSNPAVVAERQLLAYTQINGPEYEDAVFTFIGKYAGLNCCEYDGIYIKTDATGNDIVNDFIAPEMAILASTVAAGTMVYGAIAVTVSGIRRA